MLAGAKRNGGMIEARRPQHDTFGVDDASISSRYPPGLAEKVFMTRPLRENITAPQPGLWVSSTIFTLRSRGGWLELNDV